jgi:proteic killer suppression protein
MIRSIRHKGLKRLYHDDDRSRLPAVDIARIRRILAKLDAARVPTDMETPTFNLHRLKGERKAFWAVTVRANGRIIFRIRNGDAFDVDYVDYH